MVKRKKATSNKNGTKVPKSMKRNANAPKMTIVDRVLRYARADEVAEQSKRYAALLGDERPVDVPLASYTKLLQDGAKAALASLGNSMVKEGADLQFQVSRVAIRPFANPDFSIVDARKVAAEYGKAGYDGIGSVRFCAVPNPDNGADMIAMDTVALFSGNPPPRVPGRLKRRARATDGVERSATITFTLDDPAAVKAALAAMFYPPLARLPVGDPFDEEDQVFAKGSKRAERAFVTLMCRSQLPVKKMLVGFGAGKSVLDGVNGRIEYLLKESCKGTQEVVHRDLVAHFWFDELRRLELDHLTVPKIRLR